MCLKNNPINPAPITLRHLVESFLYWVFSFVSAHRPECGSNRLVLRNRNDSSVFWWACPMSRFKSWIDWVMLSILLCIISNSFLSAWFKYYPTTICIKNKLRVLQTNDITILKWSGLVAYSHINMQVNIFLLK